MTGAVAAIRKNVPSTCHAKRCDRDGCRVGLKETPSTRIVVDMDCDGLNLPVDGKRCDYLFVGEEPDTALVAPIELKSGGVRPSEAIEQLEGGIEVAESWLPPEIPFRLIPVLAHGKKIHRDDLKALRSRTVKLRRQEARIQLVRCGDPLSKALGKR